MQQRLVHLRELVHRTAAARARHRCRGRTGGVDPRQRHRFGAFGVVHVPDALAVGLVAILRHADPAVVHAQRLEDLAAHVLVVGQAAHPRDDLAEHGHARRRVVTRASARLVVHPRVENTREVLGVGLVPWLAFQNAVGERLDHGANPP